ncbi:MAG: hypothetical protein ACE148_02300 [Vicinamibacterales bacterium]
MSRAIPFAFVAFLAAAAVGSSSAARDLWSANQDSRPQKATGGQPQEARVEAGRPARVTAVRGQPTPRGSAKPAGTQPAAPEDRAALERELAALRRSAALLERQLELARGDKFYLILDPSTPDLALMLGGAELQRFKLLGLQVGRPRVGWVKRASGLRWQGRTWTGGALDPPRESDRIVIQAAEPGQKGEPEAEEQKPPPIPPTAEEMYKVPPRYHIRFEGGLSIEIRPHEADLTVGLWRRFRTWWDTKWRDAAAATWAADHDAVRLRVVLNPADAESLYRALPPNTSLLVLDSAR